MKFLFLILMLSSCAPENYNEDRLKECAKECTDHKAVAYSFHFEHHSCECIFDVKGKK